MSDAVKAPVQAPSAARARKAAPPPLRSLLLQRCACGGGSGFAGECPECRRERIATTALPHLQAKLVLSQPGDPYEQEAERVADAVMRATAGSGPPEEVEDEGVVNVTGGAPVAGSISRLVQREVSGELDEEEEEEIVQASASAARAGVIDPHLRSSVENLGERGDPLPADARDFFGRRLGYDFGSVRVRTDADAAGTARRIRARAFTVGNAIAFAPGEYDPVSPDGRRLLAHELTHVVQQNPALARFPDDATAAVSARHPVTAPTPPPALVQRDDEDAPEVIGYIAFFNAAGDDPFELNLTQSPTLDPVPRGIYRLTYVSGTATELRFSGSVAGQDFIITLESPPEPAVRRKMTGAATIMLAIRVGPGIPGDVELEQPGPGGIEEDVDEEEPQEGEVGAEMPPGVPGEEGEEEAEGGGGGGDGEREEGGGGEATRRQEGSEGGSGDSDQRGSKYGWFGLIRFLPESVVKALEVAFEALGNSEDYLALRDLVMNLGELDEHGAAFQQMLSSPEKLLEVVLGIEDEGTAEAIDKLGRWVLTPAQKRRPKPGGRRAKGLAGVTGKVLKLLERVRATLRPVFLVRKQFQEVMGLVGSAVASPGAEAIFDLVNDPEASRDAARERVDAFAASIAEGIQEQLAAAQEFFELPTEALEDSEFVTREELAVAVTRAIARMVPKHIRPLTWAAERAGLLDVLGRNLVSGMVPEGVLEAINERLRTLLAEEVLAPLADAAGPLLEETIERIGPLLETSARDVLGEALLQRDAVGRGPSEVDEGQLAELLGESRSQPLPGAVRSEMERATGFDFGRVRVHADASAGRAATLLDARAFTRGSDVFFQPSQYAPETPAGRRLLAHELVHVAQQTSGAPAGLIQRSALELAEKWVANARERMSKAAGEAFTPSPAREASAEASMRSLVRILGRVVRSENNPRLPEGYRYTYTTKRTRPRGGRPATTTREITGVRREAGWVLYLPPLRIDPRTKKLELNLQSRFDPNAGARQRLRTLMRCRPDEQAHHVVPLQLKSHPVVREATGSNEWDINGRENGECLSVTYHRGSHPVYTEMVREELDDIEMGQGGSVVWRAIKRAFLDLVETLKRGLRARKYRMR